VFLSCHKISPESLTFPQYYIPDSIALLVNLKGDTHLSKFIEDAEDLQLAPATVAAAVASAPAPVQPATPAVVKPATVAPIVSESCDDEFDASTVSTALPKVKVTAGQVCRVALLGPVSSGFRHFHEGTKSYIICNSERDPAHLAQITKIASCCQSLPESKWARAALVIQYLGVDATSGKIIQPGWRIAAVVIPGPGWSALKNIIPEGGKLTDVDVKMSARTSGFGNDFNLQTAQAAYLKDEATAAKVQKLAAPLVKHLAEKLGKKLSDLQIRALSASEGASTPGDLDDLDGIV
jgi:hypothetical protein